MLYLGIFTILVVFPALILNFSEICTKVPDGEVERTRGGDQDCGERGHGELAGAGLGDEHAGGGSAEIP